MYKISFNQIAKLLLVSFTMVIVSCREDSDDVKSYACEEIQNFAEANVSLEGQFRAIWTAMNCDYPMWDYEEQQGFDWDKVYDEFLPHFKKLDKEYNTQNPIPDSLVYELYDSIFAPFHDGHLYMYLKNIHTGKKIWNKIFPQYTRNRKNGNMDSYAFRPTLKYYNTKGELTEHIQEGDYIFAQFKDDIVYFRLSEFNLTETFKERYSNKSKDRIYSLWESWLTCIQNLQSTCSLKGIIIDLRFNGGGNMLDYQYVLGALHKGNSDKGLSHQIGYYREKSGIGRLDFFQPYPLYLPIYEEHATVEAPIVILVNGYSMSFAEMTSLSAKQLKNGYVIGTKTFGAHSLLTSFSDVSNYYEGNVGDPALKDEDEKASYFAPFFINISTYAFLSLDNQIIDGAGIDPNETVHFDEREHHNNGKDNQLDRALEYIRTKKMVNNHL